MHNKRILTICPTRRRPVGAWTMFNSFKKTNKSSEILFLLDKDDPEASNYIQLLGEVVLWKESRTYTQIINEAFKRHPEEEFYCVTNDDFVFHTEGWDIKLIQEIENKGGTGIAFGNDLVQGPNMPTCSVISGDIPRALGWLQYPKLTHLFGDTILGQLGRQANCLFYRHDVVIEHRHFMTKQVPPDDIYRKTNSQEMYRQDEAAYIKWFKSQMPTDVATVKGLICSKKDTK